MQAEPIAAPSHSRPHAVDRQIECGESIVRLYRGAIAPRSRISQAPHSAGWFLLEVDH